MIKHYQSTIFYPSLLKKKKKTERQPYLSLEIEGKELFEKILRVSKKASMN